MGQPVAADGKRSNATKYELVASSVKKSSGEICLENIQVNSLRNSLLLDCGEVESGSKVVYVLQLKNRLGMILVPDSIQKSCGCVSVDLPKDEWKDGEPLELRVGLYFPDIEKRAFLQKLSIFDKNEALAPLVIQFTANVKPPFSIQPPFLQITDMDGPTIHHFKIIATNSADSLIDSQVQTSSLGVKFEVVGRGRSELGVRATVDPTQCFRGNVSERLVLSLSKIKRGSDERFYVLESQVKFTNVLLSIPKHLTFLREGSNYTGKIVLIGNMFEEPTDVDAFWESDQKPIPMKLNITRKDLAAATFTLDQAGTRDDSVVIKVKSTGQEVSIPVKFVD